MNEHPDIARARQALEYLEKLPSKTDAERKENEAIVARARINFDALVVAINKAS